MNDLSMIPQGTFAENMEKGFNPEELNLEAGQGFNPEELNLEAGQTFRLKLSFKGEDIGYMGLTGDWCIHSASKEKAVVLKPYIQGGKIYFQCVGGDYDGKYLSYSFNNYVGLYVGYNSTPWEFQDGKLYSVGAKQYLSMYSSGYQYLYAWDKYSVLTVEKEYI